MAESSPLEAAAMSDEQLTVIRVLAAGGWLPPEDIRELLAEVDRLRAIAAYEAEQTTPDLDELRRIFVGAATSPDATGVRVGYDSISIDAGLLEVVAHLKGETR